MPQDEPQAVRFIFEFEGDQVRLVSQQNVNVAVTGFDLRGKRAPGDYVELRGAEGALSAVPIRAGMGASVEVFPEPGQQFAHTEVAHPKGAFTVVVPAPKGTQQVAVVRVAPPVGARPGPGEAPRPLESKDLATFDFQVEGGGPQ